jgi:hypothetical protein
VNLADGLHLHARIAAVRTEWLQIQRELEHVDDDELYLAIAGARMNILDAKDRLEQLLTDPEPEPEPEAALT